jgi:hypothetical protein
MLRMLTAAAVGAICLSACSGGQQETTTAEAAPAAVPVNPAPPGVWALDILGPDGRSTAERARICDDGSLGPVFARALPVVNAAPCRLTAPVVLNPDAVTATCMAGEAEYVATTDPQGDLGRTFQLEVSLKPAAGGAELKQTTRVRRVGDCPADWTPGDSAAPGSHDITNVLTGVTKTGMNVN